MHAALPDLDALLPASAALARRVATESCLPDPASGISCAWYHGFLPYLRLLGLVATPAHHAAFFQAALGALGTNARTPRVLVSGAADHYMLAQAWAGCRAHGLTPAITVLDLCETPLALNRWYAGQAGIALATLHADVLDYRDAGAFDVICTHSLLGRFAPDERPALAAAWHRLLAPGGRVMTVNRVRAGADAGRAGFNASHATALRDTVLERARRSAVPLDVAPEDLARDAEAYAARHRVHPVRSRDEVHALFTGAGFEIERLEVLQAGSSDERPVSGPTMLDGSHYACVVARKPR